MHLLCQDRHAFALDWVDAAGDWDGGALEVNARRSPVRCTVYRPDIGDLLPVYVADRYEGIEARPFPRCSDEEVERYVERNVAAVREVAERTAPDVALANHLVMGPAILARALGGDAGVPYAVKVHGSALEYTVKSHPRFLPWAREGVAGARGILVGSRHTAESLWATLADDGVRRRTRLGPPGVDVGTFGPREPAEAAAGLAGLRRRLAAHVPPQDAGETSAFSRDAAEAAAALAAVDPQGGERLVGYVGKLLVAKGVDLLVAAWPLVIAQVGAARLVVVGFGAYREALGRLVAALGAGDLETARSLAAEGRALEGGPPGGLAHLLAFLDGLEGERRERYLRAAAGLGEQVTFTGRLEHAELADVLPALEVLAVTSTFPEAFGMVAAEAAACGVLPVSAGHSGLAEVSRVLGAGLDPRAREWLSFPVDDRAVQALADRLAGWLEAPPDLRDDTRRRLVATARDRYSWEGVARGVIDAAQGRLDGLQVPTR